MKIVSKHKQLKKEVDDLWYECVKARMGYKSEWSGKKGRQIGGEHILQSHHICGKDAYSLRYELVNGICLTQGEHKYIAHRQDRAEMFRTRILELRGKDFYERMHHLKWLRKTTDLRLVKLHLEQELKHAADKLNL